MSADASEKPTRTVLNPSALSEQETVLQSGAAFGVADSLLEKPWYRGREIEGIYRVEGEIGRGGMGVIYKVTDQASQQEMVIKTLLPSVAHDQEYKKRFIREAEEWVKIGVHPHIVRAYTAYEIDYIPAVVAEFIDGESLYDLLQRGAPTLDQALSIALQICYGMASAHDRGIVHRDLKPSNILLTKDGTAKVTDFGLVKKMLEAETLPTISAVSPLYEQTLLTQGVMGTPEYIAPEQWNGQGSQQSDIYAFGIILYELCCGKRPFDYPTLKGLERVTAYQTAHCEKQPPSPTEIKPDLPVVLSDLILECLQKDVGKRSRSFRAIAKRLQKLGKQLFGSAMPSEPKKVALNRQAELDQAWGFIRLARGCISRGEYDKAQQEIEEARRYFNHLHLSAGLGACHFQEAKIAVLTGQNVKAHDNYKKALSEYQRAGDNYGTCGCFMGFGHAYVEIGNYEMAMEYFNRAMDQAVTHGFLQLQASCRQNIGGLQVQLGWHEKAAISTQAALSIYQHAGDLRGISSCYLNLGAAYRALKSNDEALQYYLKAIEIMSKLGHREGIANCYNNIGNCYQLLGRYQVAKEMYLKSLGISQEIKDLFAIAHCKRNMGTLYGQLGMLPDAMQYLEDALAIFTQLNNTRMRTVIESLIQAIRAGRPIPEE